MTKTEFQTTLRGMINQEFSYIPAEEMIDHSFSRFFEKRMDKLLRRERAPYRKWLNTTAKRVAAVILVLFAVTAGLASVDAIREPVIRFFTEVFEDHIDIVPQGESAGKITHEYRITELPEGYTQTDIKRNDYYVSTTYANKNGDTLSFDQCAEAAGWSLDNEHGNISHAIVNGTEVLVYIGDRVVFTVWYLNGYEFVLTHRGDLNKADILHIISSIQ